MNPTCFARYMSKYLTEYLPGIQGVSYNTIASKRDAYILLLKYLDDTQNIKAEDVDIPLLSRETIIKYLESHNIKFTIENGIVITDHDAIATHNDPDFWIADNETWFAAGRQKPSPADAVLSISAARGVRPVLYLEQTNIMDFDARRAQWRDDGITVITSPSELD